MKFKRAWSCSFVTIVNVDISVNNSVIASSCFFRGAFVWGNSPNQFLNERHLFRSKIVADDTVVDLPFSGRKNVVKMFHYWASIPQRVSAALVSIKLSPSALSSAVAIWIFCYHAEWVEQSCGVSILALYRKTEFVSPSKSRSPTT